MLPTVKPVLSTVIVEGAVMLERKFAGTSAPSGVPRDHFVSSLHVPPPVAVHWGVMSGLRAAYNPLEPKLRTKSRSVKRFIPKTPGIKPLPLGSGKFKTSTGT